MSNTQQQSDPKASSVAEAIEELRPILGEWHERALFPSGPDTFEMTVEEDEEQIVQDALDKMNEDYTIENRETHFHAVYVISL